MHFILIKFKKYFKWLTLWSVVMSLMILMIGTFYYPSPAFIEEIKTTLSFLPSLFWHLFSLSLISRVATPLAIVLVICNFYLNRHDQELRVLLKGNYFSLIFFSISYLALVFLNNLYFPNYVYSAFHINLIFLKNLCVFSFSLILIDLFDRNVFSVKNNINHTSLKIVIVWVVFLSPLIYKSTFSFYLPQLTVYMPNHFMERLTQHLSYEEKQQKLITSYGFLKFVAHKTPDNSIIAVPPQVSPWLMEGNVGYLRYFWYPRHIIQFDQTGPVDQIPDDADYAIIAEGGWAGDKGWPKATTSAEVFWIINPRNGEILNEVKGYDFDPITNPELKHSYGLIKFKKEAINVGNN